MKKLQKMVLLIFLNVTVLSNFGCSKSSESESEQMNECQKVCKMRYNTDATFVGPVTGKCFCK